ncbi:hypothetical protein FZC78_15820 [Rossellomorea vietnamensis]|uniref:Uncharacterized protein n=1 Tax=Rossellomorea vietnamensis TaxID=218284 RepID=A0A5D4NMF8_9BACI|nr:hypothetical protein [Rossellomorea vietnamensis]TYS15465.1 hypothetical protein FZC78_15820 [Rossellomorea vietnamensis]
MNRWSTFVEKVKAEDFIIAADCCFMQNPLTMLMAKYNEPCHSIKKFISEVEEVILDINISRSSFGTRSVRKCENEKVTGMVQASLQQLYQAGIWESPFIAGRIGGSGAAS